MVLHHGKEILEDGWDYLEGEVGELSKKKIKTKKCIIHECVFFIRLFIVQLVPDPRGSQ